MALRSDRLDAIVNLSKRRGFVYPSSEIYGGLRAAWDYGPLGVELKNNIKRQWWRYDGPGARRHRRPRLERDPGPRGLGGQRPRHHVHRPADRVPVLPQAVPRRPPDRGVRGEARPVPAEHGLADITCPNCGNKGAFTEPRKFNGMLRTYLGAVEDESGPGVPAAGDRAGHLHQLQERAHHLAARRSRSASARSASRSATRSRRATSSSAPASSSRWRWSSSSSPGTDEEWHEYWIEAPARLVDRPRGEPGKPAPVRAPEGEAVATTPSGRWTSSTASTSSARSGASSRASRTAPTST